jgi:hypothetical protein
MIADYSKGTKMKQVSVKTLVLLLALFAFAAICYSTAWTPSVRADTHWWDDDHEPNQPKDPNQPVDPNAPTNPMPEMSISTGSLLWLSVMPADVNEPNQPPQPAPPEKV